MSENRETNSTSSNVRSETDEEATPVATASPDDIPTLYEEQSRADSSETRTLNTDDTESRADYGSESFTLGSYSQSQASIRTESIRTGSKQQIVPEEVVRS